MKTTRDLLATGSALSLLLASAAHAGTIIWGGAQDSANFESDGQALETDIGDVTFELGVFTGGFVPSRANVNQWAANWLAFPGSATDPDIGGGTDTGYDGSVSPFFGADASDPVVTGTDAGEASNTDYALNSQVYIWGWNSKDLSTQPEWTLITGDEGTGSTDTNWLMPSDQGANDAFTKLWTVENASTAVVGRIDNTVGTPSGITNTPNLGISDVQFEVVPEPSSLMLILLGLLPTIQRRR